MSQNYFNTLPLRLQLEQLGKCRFMERDEFADGVERLRGKKIVIVGCGAQGLNQGLNLRDSGLDVSYALREEGHQRAAPVLEERHGERLHRRHLRGADPDGRRGHEPDPGQAAHGVVSAIMPLMKEGACLDYAHGFNLVEEGMQIRDRTSRWS
jgi:ketol-acid reductoisomerase